MGEDNQWILIDYKTDQPKPEEYRTQLIFCRLGLEKILGTEVEAFTYSTEENEFEKNRRRRKTNPKTRFSCFTRN